MGFRFPFFTSVRAPGIYTAETEKKIDYKKENQNQLAKALYEGQHFYKIVKKKNSLVTLQGPFDNIYYVERTQNLDDTEDAKVYGLHEYKFVQVVDGTIIQAFMKEEILVTDRIL